MKRYLKHIIVPLFVVFATSIAYTQTTDSLSLTRTKTVYLTPNVDTIFLDDFSIVPNSFKTNLDEENYKIDETDAMFIEILNSSLTDTLKVQYRVFPFKITKEETSFKEYENAEQDSIEQIILAINQVQKPDVFDFDNLKIQGGLGRALNVGNNQNLVVNSNLNLRLSGQVGDGIEIVGVLTDSNIPFQPQGNTQQIRELDQVFLQFSKDEHQVTLGDYEYRKPTSYFLNFDKRLQGVNYSGKFNTDNDWSITTSNSGAVSRGTYARNEFLGEEGNQGPYKLFGANNESFIIILAGTEQVFIDGIQLERGLDRDFTIDYNTGEITFTSRQLITNRKRVSIEFEYSNQTYNNSLVFSETEFKKGPLSLRLNLYTQQDSKNRARLTDTTLNTRGLFTEIGDRQNDFFIDSFNPEEFNPDRIQYRIARDSLINNTVFDTIFVASRNFNEPLFGVVFTFVGENGGNYDISNEITNGRTFVFVDPQNGVPQGSFIAQIKLNPPTQQQLFSVTSAYEFSKHHSLSIETSLTNRDLNTLSTIGNDDNQGVANKLDYRKTFFFGKDSTKNNLRINADYELRNKNFRFIERYRPVEFSRNWNVRNNTDSLDEGYGNLALDYDINNKTSVGYKVSQYNQRGFYNGLNHTGSFRFSNNEYNVTGNLNFLSATQGEISSTFFRPDIELERRIGTWTIGTRARQNIRELNNTTTNLLESNSIGDEDYSFYISTADTSRIPITIKYNRHIDSTPFTNSLTELFNADELSFTGALRKSKNHNANFTFTYRDLNVVNQSLTDEDDRVSLLGKFNYSGNYLKGVVKTGFDYELGSGREPRREFTFIQVANGEGVYTHIDFNGNGLQEITEFEIAPFSDQAQFVRVFTNTNEFINVDSGRLNQWIQIEPAVQWRNEEGLKGLLARISINSTLNLQTRLFEDAPGARFNPYTFDVSREGLVSNSNRINNRIIYNKLSNKFRTSYINQVNQNKVQLLSGFEQRQLTEHRLLTDYYFENKLTLQLETSLINNEFFSENFSQKTFDFDQVLIQPRLTWVLSNEMRVGTEYSYRNSKNIESLGGQTALQNALAFDFSWNKRNEFALTARFNFDNVEYSGDPNDAVAFSILNGLQDGNNALWNLGFEKTVFTALRLNLTYDGRTLGDLRPVHTGRARITAVF